MVSTFKGCKNNSMMTPNLFVYTKNLSAIKSLRQFSETLYVKNNDAILWLGVAKAKRKTIKTDNMLWSNITKRRGH